MELLGLEAADGAENAAERGAQVLGQYPPGGELLERPFPAMGEADLPAERLALPMEKAVVNIDRYGNTSAASIPLALDEAVRAGRVKRGDVVLSAAMGAGITWGTLVLRW